ncbi:MAG: hypothetical protein IPN51_13555 [Chloracidobacterium sp.]|nr:hypothetical protein [Chloracidobacterium sp.]
MIDATEVAQKTDGRPHKYHYADVLSLSRVLPLDDAIAQIKKAIEKTYYKKGQSVMRR